MAVRFVSPYVMRAVRLSEYGGPDVLQVEEVDRPEPETGELLVEVEAAGVNPVDTYFRDGSYESVGPPFTPGVDVAGTVAATGEDVETFTEGDRVYGTGIGNGAYQGSYAEYATVPTDRVVALPDSVDASEAGAAGVVGVTAWRALIDHADLEPAEACLVHGGSGGVGHAAVQVADAVSARVLTTASEQYHDALAELGADVVLDYGREDLADAVREASDGGVDAILDHRLDDYLQFDADVAAQGGRVVGIGENSPDPAFTNDGAARSKDVSYQFMSMFNTPDLRVPLRGVAHLMETDRLTIEIDRSYDLADAAQAQRDVMNESVFGKLVIEP
ncbi:Zn-dependent oxidoreductase, NADPH:quinone reductase [Natronococcus occultus SP4]|uniref:Zn-dependent oxidoreductase, NADPH:quinone reductase n=2 Tax=Natronococcus occultus TaxID=29288 RepID=L0K4U2_9EURY|nr:Zn-dependent oxidoreductase, NADPH:quinone reductase [Natronococcus occultus SP4]